MPAKHANHLHLRPTEHTRKHDDEILPPPLAARQLPRAFSSVPWYRRRWALISCLVLSLWVFLTADSFFLHWLSWSLTGGPPLPDERIVRHCPARNYALPIVVVMPLIATQFNRLEWNLNRWTRDEYSPCAPNFALPKPHFSFFFDRPLDDEKTAKAVAQIRQFLGEPPVAGVLQACFSGVSITSANLTAAQTRNSYWLQPVHNVMQTGGSNRLFESAFTAFGGGRFRHMFWMEPDAYPIRRGWLEALERESRWGDFWVRGSTMRHVPKFVIGMEPFRSRYQRHINGNALYALDDGCFDRYRELTRETFGDGAFDVAMNLYLLGMRRIMTYQSVAFRFQKSRVIADIGLLVEEEERLRESFPGTFLIHGKAGFVRFPKFNFMQY